ncbi:precorrin-4 C(11)-methyltransferase [Helicovermis profundi]|uniref:Precorrin-4 C(11)-methyltransferase n=1 Tax=Helicovermis profundi TaxID=3065157 RepID=A0AAU9E2E6_9FIRM|nr:precorrin-4 C(11)-methyltransferase [Clostridia bacterium S502]
MKKVYFIGAGPGDPELMTLKGKRIVETSDILIYAGSLVNPEVMKWRKKESDVYNSASMTLDEVIGVMLEGIKLNKKIVRIHTGDPSIYGAIREQIDRLSKENIESEVVPGVSSFVASAAALNMEFTLPDITQTVILTRMEGRTPVPEEESLDKLASHKASMAIFLSVQMIDKVVDKLLVHYPLSTPVAVVQRASWPDQLTVLGNLENISQKVKEANISKTAQILVGNFLGNEYSLSKLYDKSFSHEYRDAK